MMVWFIALLPIVLIVSTFFWDKNERGKNGLWLWVAVCAAISFICMAWAGWMNLFVFVVTVFLSLWATIHTYRLLMTYPFGKKWTAKDHSGAGCMTLTLLFVVFLNLFGRTLVALLL